MRISDWSSDVCSSDLRNQPLRPQLVPRHAAGSPGAAGAQPELAAAALALLRLWPAAVPGHDAVGAADDRHRFGARRRARPRGQLGGSRTEAGLRPAAGLPRSAEHTSELQSLMRTSYAVFFLQKKNNN